MMKQMTPRTDEAALDADNWNEVVYTSFARQLETELNETKAALEREQQDCAALRQMVRELRDALELSQNESFHAPQSQEESEAADRTQEAIDAAIAKANQLLQ